MTKGNKIFWAVVVVVIIAAVVLLNSKQSVAPTNSDTNTPPAQNEQSNTNTKPQAAKPANTQRTISTNYQEMVAKYEGRRIQFNQNCQATPSSQTYKNGTQVMFDNRGSLPTVITVDGVKYPTSAYTYRLITLSSKTLPHTVIINCGSQNNVAQITLQP